MIDLYKYSKEILRESNVSFKKKEYQLDDYGFPAKPFPQKVYHGTYLAAAEAILKGKQKGGISFTGNLNDAIAFSFQRAETNEQDGIVFEISSTHIKKSLLVYNDSTGFGIHTFYPKKLPTAAFKTIRHIPYMKVWGKKRNILDLIFKEIKTWKLGATQGKGDYRSKITLKKDQYKDVEKKLKENNWKLSKSMKKAGENKVWEWKKDGQELFIIRYAKSRITPKPKIVIIIS